MWTPASRKTAGIPIAASKGEITVYRHLITMLAIGCLAALNAADVAVDLCRSTDNWTFFNGAEFKGATGKLTGSPDGLKLDYDFTQGGAYVGCHNKKLLLPEVKEFKLVLQSAADVTFNYRIIDSTGRVFQGKTATVKAGVETRLTLSVDGPWSSVWGGDNSGKSVSGPVKSVWLMVSKTADAPLAGSVLIKSFTAAITAEAANAATGKPFEYSLNGWSFAGEWIPLINGAALKLTTIHQGAKPIDLEIIFPDLIRDKVKRFRLAADSSGELIYPLPFADKVNPRNVYQITLSADDREGGTSSFTTPVAGSLSDTVNLGKPQTSMEIAASKFGTCAHFSYAPKNEGAFKVWYPKEKIIDEISNCGFKFVREGLVMDKLPDGSWKMRDADLKTLQMLHDRNMEQIAVIGMSADESLEEFLQRVTAYVDQSKHLVKVYELGNEPNNFGNWLKKYGGTWNGYEKDGSVSPWVKAHLEYTNAAADLIKKIAPDKTVIGLGACAPTNFHALKLGVSKNLDGVTEHPYTFALPPEKVPFGLNLTKRDGIAVGDDVNSFKGLVESYHAMFAQTGVKRSLWVTEFGFSTYVVGPKKLKALYAGYSEEAQAVYLLRRFVESLALPVAVTCQYDFVDDYGSEPLADEANFGLLRSDYSRKPSWYVLRRMNSLLAGAEPDPTVAVEVTGDKLHRGMTRGILVNDWDDVKIAAANGVRVYAFARPDTPGEKMIAVWSMQPYSKEFNQRFVSIAIDNLKDYIKAKPVAIDLVTQVSYDLAVTAENGKAVIKDLPLGNHVLLIKFFKE